MPPDASHERTQRSRSFGLAAADYAEHRPDYPTAAVQWALEPLGATGAQAQVVDLGAGTGRLTEVLVRLGVSATAVEPDEAMLAELRHRLPNVEAFCASAESIPLPAQCMDAVLAGQAFHWFEPERAMAEIARILKPSGVFAVLWNSDDTSVSWVAEMAKVSRSSVSFVQWPARSGLPSHAAFTAPERAEFEHAQVRTAESMAATIGTFSHVLTVPADERQQVLDRVRAFLRSCPETREGEFSLPIITTAERVLRLA